MTHIKINDVSPRMQYVADGTQTTFTYNFPIFTTSDMEVYLGDEKQTSGYTISGAGADNGGSVIFTKAPAEGLLITLYRNLSIERTSDFQEGGAFRASVINSELDYQVAIAQQLNEKLNRALLLKVTSDSNTDGLLENIIAAEEVCMAKASEAENNANIAQNAIASLDNATTENKGLIQLATTEEVTLGINNAKAVTPATLAEKMASISLGDASITEKGVVQLATTEEVSAGTDAIKAVTPLTLAEKIASISLPNATTQTKGIVQLSSAINSDSETIAATSKAVKNLAATIPSTSSFAPKPTSSAGVGQWQFAVTEVNTVSANYTLPSGGTWVWVAFQTKGADSVMKIGGGIDAGGTILLGGNNWRINTTFCTGAYSNAGYYYQIIIIRYRIA